MKQNTTIEDLTQMFKVSDDYIRDRISQFKKQLYVWEYLKDEYMKEHLYALAIPYSEVECDMIGKMGRLDRFDLMLSLGSGVPYMIQAGFPIELVAQLRAETCTVDINEMRTFGWHLKDSYRLPDNYWKLTMLMGDPDPLTGEVENFDKIVLKAERTTRTAGSKSDHFAGELLLRLINADFSQHPQVKKLEHETRNLISCLASAYDARLTSLSPGPELGKIYQKMLEIDAELKNEN